MANILADLIMLVHLLFVVFAMVGGLLLFWRRWVLWLHLPAVAWAAIVEFGGLICPLTPLENWLRVMGDGGSYQGGFIAHYVWPVLYPEGLDRGIQLALGAVVLVVNLAIYGWVFCRQRSKSK
jgi:hypothetical protein